MSFFKNLTKDFENLLSDDKKKKKAETHGDEDKQRGNINNKQMFFAFTSMFCRYDAV